MSHELWIVPRVFLIIFSAAGQKISQDVVGRNFPTPFYASPMTQVFLSQKPTPRAQNCDLEVDKHLQGTASVTPNQNNVFYK